MVVIQVVNCTKTCGNVLQSGFWDVFGGHAWAVAAGE